MDLNIAIVEDNTIDFQYLASLLKNWANENLHKIDITHFTNEYIIDKIHHINYDIVFSDIDLKCSATYTGINLCECLRKNGFKNEIIFTTAFNEYVFEGYNVQAFNYLVKPISVNTLNQCMNRYVEIHEHKFYCLQDRGCYTRIQFGSILYIEKQGHNAIFHTDTQLYYERKTFNNILYAFPLSFKTCHKSYIVNMNHISSLTSTEITLTNNEQIPIGRSHLNNIRNAMLDLSNF